LCSNLELMGSAMQNVGTRVKAAANRKRSSPSWPQRVGLKASLVTMLTIILVLASTGLPAFAGGTTWYQFRSGPDHTGFALNGPMLGAVKYLRPKWTFSNGGRQGDPISSGSQIFLSARGRLYSVDAYSGHQLWSRPWSGLSDSAYFTTCGRFSCNSVLYAVDEGANSTLEALRPETGRTKWSFSYPALSWPTVVGTPDVPGRHLVYVSSRRGAVFAFSASGQRPLWKVWPTRNGSCRNACSSINSVTPAVSGGLVYVTATDGRVYALGARRGQLMWSTEVGHRGNGLTCLAISLNHLLVATSSAEVVSLNAANGRREWTYSQAKHQPPKVVTGIAAGYSLRPVGGKRTALSRPTVYVTGLGGHTASAEVVALNTSNGRVRWKFRVGAGTAMDPSVSNGVVYVSDTRGDLYAIDATTGRLVRLIAHLKGYSPTYPAIVFNWLYVGNYGFEASGG
jgi:outer membrane protein assembly factor BamB